MTTVAMTDDCHAIQIAHLKNCWSLDNEAFRRINLDGTFLGIPEAVAHSSLS
jgi:hypothetical protein